LPKVYVLLVGRKRRLTFSRHDLPSRTGIFPALSGKGDFILGDGPSFLESEGKVGYRWGRGVAEWETMDYLEFIARVTSHIPDKGQVDEGHRFHHGFRGRGPDHRSPPKDPLLGRAEDFLTRSPTLPRPERRG
jgi:hypothetical protein